MTTLTYPEAVRLVREAILSGQVKTTWIYAIQAGENGPVKIGRTDNPDERLKGLQPGNPEKLRGLAAWKAPIDDEAWVHGLFAEHRIRGEWFRPAPELIEFVEDMGCTFVWKGEPTWVLPEDYVEFIPE